MTGGEALLTAAEDTLCVTDHEHCISVSILDHAPDWQAIPGNGETVFYGRKVLHPGEYSSKEYQGLCVARWEDSDGQHGSLVLPHDIYADAIRVQKLKQAGAQNFARMRLILKTWFLHRKRLPNRLIARNLLRIDEWKNVNAMRRLYKTWGKGRFDGDDEMFTILELWAADHESRAAAIRSIKFHADNQRAEAYNHFADSLAQQYRHLVIDNAGLQPGQELIDVARSAASRTGYLRKVLRTTVHFYGSIYRKGIQREEGRIPTPVSEPVSNTVSGQQETAMTRARNGAIGTASKPNMKEYRLVVAVKNNLLMTAMSEKGMKTAADLSRAASVEQSAISGYLSLKLSPFAKDRSGDRKNWVPRVSAERISSALGKTIPELFPEDYLFFCLENNKTEINLGKDEVKALMHTPELFLSQNTISNANPPDEAYSAEETREVLELALDTLSPRDAKVLRMRFGIGMNTDHTLEEVGKQFDVTRERIRTIEAKALRKL